MTYVHLANGDVEQVTNDDWIEESGTPNAFRKKGKEYAVIGVYADEVEHPASPEVQAQKDAEDAENRAQFDKWRESQKTQEAAKQGDKKL
jgi:hypothetical protein